MDWIHLAQNRDQWRALVSMVIILRIQYTTENFLTSWVTISFSRRELLRGFSYRDQGHFS